MILASLAALALPVRPALATGTPVGTEISNVASVSYVLNGRQGEKDSNPVTIIVDEKLDLALTWEDAACLTVAPGEQQAMLTYRLTNTGNAGEAFTLAVNNTLPGDQFDPLGARIVLDSNGNGGFNAGDRVFDPANPPLLAADAALLIFVFNDIPAPLGNSDQGTSRLIATAVTGSGTPGTAFPPQTEGTRGAVVGPSGAQASADGCSRVESDEVTLRKSAEVRDQAGGTEPRPGAVITYRIDVEVGGTNATTGLVVSDAVPAHTAYLPGSLRLITATGAQTFTDAVDGDRGQVVQEPPGSGQNVVQFPLGDLDAGTHTVTFQVTIL
jgi:uncharacterized repeat protein (TIGR01451 family)